MTRIIVDPLPSPSRDICAICDMRGLSGQIADLLCVVVVAVCLVLLLIGSTHPCDLSEIVLFAALKICE